LSRPCSSADRPAAGRDGGSAAICRDVFDARLLQSLRNAYQRSHVLDVVASDLLDRQRLAESAVLLVVASCLKAIQISCVREPTPGGHFFVGSARARQHQASAAGRAANRAHAGGVLTRLAEVIDVQATTGHDQLEPALRIGEHANILQGISINNEQISKRSRRHDAHLPFEAQ
jgi:hypothetical protein